MNRSTRDKFASATNADLTSGTACWETPPAIFAQLNEDFGPFEVDLTADAQRHLCPVWFGPGGLYEDALTAPWMDALDAGTRLRGYSNPPYGPFVPKILAKAKAEAAEGFTSVLLLPLRVTVAFREHVLRGAANLLFCDKRITFWENGAPRINPKTGKPDSALFDSMVVVYRPYFTSPYITPLIGEWHVPPHVR